jgi:methylated-DNA-[protein]-cysteine S-methyltransferase
MNKRGDDMYISYYESPIGILEICATDTAVLAIAFVETKQEKYTPNAITYECEKQLREYFNRDREVFDLPLFLIGTTFEKKVWDAVLDVPYKCISTYKQIGEKMEHGASARPIGTAVGKNNHAIIIPCHRIVRSDGKPSGYAWGLARKEWLLAFENAEKEK